MVFIWLILFHQYPVTNVVMSVVRLHMGNDLNQVKLVDYDEHAVNHSSVSLGYLER